MMSNLERAMAEMKCLMEEHIRNGGAEGHTSLIRSSSLINIVHEVIKADLVESGIDASLIRPPINETKPEMTVAGFLKKKDQDVCVVPKDINPVRRLVNWGPGRFEEVYDEYGEEYITHTLIINVRSQLSSVAKNSDTLLERTFAEPLNLHMIYNNIVLGEVYLIPVVEYDDQAMKDKKVRFKTKPVNLQKYISFFSEISSSGEMGEDYYKYERCALIIVDFRPETPIVYNSTKELIDAGLLPTSYPLEYKSISYVSFIDDILSIYCKRFGKNHIFRGTEYFE